MSKVESWQVEKIGDVCDVIAGQSPPGKYYNQNGEGMPFYHGKKDFGVKYIGDPTTWTTEVKRIAIAGDILMSVRAPVGPVNFASQEICIGRGLAAIRAGKEIDKEFLFYFFLKHEDEITGTSGAVFNSINKTQIQNIEIPVPPLPEQKRIVALLDEAFDALDQVRANAERNLVNTREVFDSFLQSVFSNPDWKHSKLGNTCKLENGDRGKNYPKRAEYTEEGIPWINTGHILSDGTLSKETMNFITQEKFESLRSGKIQRGDLVYCLRGATLGKTAIVDPLEVGAIASSLVIIRPSNLLRSRFLYYFLISPNGKKLIKLYDNGAAQPNLGAKSVAKYIIPTPDLEEQDHIVSQLDTVLAETKELEAVYERKVAAVDELKKSLLQRAFAGEL